MRITCPSYLHMIPGYDCIFNDYGKGGAGE